MNLGDITEVRRVDDKNGFDQLVLPKGHKDMVKCLIRQHFREKESKLADKDEMDIVRGKGMSPESCAKCIVSNAMLLR